MNQTTQIYIPKGEWLDAFLIALKTANLEIAAPPRCYEYKFVSPKLPIIFQAIRSKEIWKDISDPDTIVYGGFTGSDIAKEQEVTPLWTFPLYNLEPPSSSFPRPQICLCSTPNFPNRETNPATEKLQGKIIYTSYPNIAREFFLKKGITVKIKETQGATEARWRVVPDNWAIVDIVNSGNTLLANQIKVIENIMSSEIVYIEDPRISNFDRLQAEKLRQLLLKVNLKK